MGDCQWLVLGIFYPSVRNTSSRYLVKRSKRSKKGQIKKETHTHTPKNNGIHIWINQSISHILDLELTLCFLLATRGPSSRGCRWAANKLAIAFRFRWKEKYKKPASRQNSPGRPSQLDCRRTPTHGVAIQALHHRLHRAFDPPHYNSGGKYSVASIRRMLGNSDKSIHNIPNYHITRTQAEANALDTTELWRH